MRDYLPRIGGGLLFVAGLVLLVTSPPRDQFDPVRLYFSLACFAAGFLLLLGLVGTDPAAAKLRRAAGPARSGPLCAVREELFVYAPTPRSRRFTFCLGIGLGALLLFEAAVVFRATPGGTTERAAAAFPLVLGAAICTGSLVRWSRMFLRTSPLGLTARLYFRTVTIRWEEVVALLERQRTLPLLPLPAVYSVYSRTRRIDFTPRLPGRERLCEIISAATGLPWD